MTRHFFALLVSSMLALTGSAQVAFDDHFQDRTLRLDYTFSGNNREQHIFLDELQQSPGWYGRRTNLDSLLLLGNGQLTVTDTLGHDTLYRHSFSTLFQEWQTSEEAAKTNKSFENVFLMPMPKHPVLVSVTLSDTHNRETSRLTHRVDPSDILIRRMGEQTVPYEYVSRGGDSKGTIDVAIVGEGYTLAEMDKFLEDCRMCVDCFQKHEPYASLMDRFNFIAVKCPSEQSGVSIPHRNLWLNTVLNSNYDTFYSERYLTTLHLKKLHDVLAGIPYEHIIILANTDNYGGGGIYNSYMMSSAHNAKTRPVIVHEFGHSFAGLGDEYFYDDQYETMYPADTEPWEPNLTTLVDFKSKWADMLPDNTEKESVGKKAKKSKGKSVAVQTEAVAKVNGWSITLPSGHDLFTHVGIYEGGGYQSKGVYRPTQECRMKINEAPVFCPVCERATRRIIDFYTR